MSTVLSEDRGAVRILTLNRPERLNAITEQLITDLNSALEAAHADAGVRAIVLTGSGRAFCAGDDLHEYAEQASTREATQAYVEELQQVTRRIMLGLFVTGGVTALLPRIVGLSRARQLLMLGERIDSAQMLDWGIAHWRVPDDDVLEEAVAVATRLAGLSERAVADLRRIMTTVSVGDLETAMAAETDATVAAFGDPDAARRVRDAAP